MLQEIKLKGLTPHILAPSGKARGHVAHRSVKAIRGYGSHPSGQGCAVPHIEGYSLDRAGEACGFRLKGGKALFAPGAGVNDRAFGGEGQYDGPANAAGAACDEHAFAVQTKVHHRLLWGV
jgi:hypothetical protein